MIVTVIVHVLPISRLSDVARTSHDFLCYDVILYVILKDGKGEKSYFRFCRLCCKTKMLAHTLTKKIKSYARRRDEGSGGLDRMICPSFQGR